MSDDLKEAKYLMMEIIGNVSDVIDKIDNEIERGQRLEKRPESIPVGDIEIRWKDIDSGAYTYIVRGLAEYLNATSHLHASSEVDLSNERVNLLIQSIAFETFKLTSKYYQII